MRLSPDTLGLFSPRAQKILMHADRAPPPPRSTIIRRLEAAGRPVFDAVVDFERQLGGISLRIGPAGAKQEIKLGIEWYERRPRRGDPDDPERTMVPIGWAWDGQEQLFMDQAGEMASYVDTIVMKSSSITRFIEQQAIGLVPRWKPPRFSVVLRPALGERLARTLGMRRVVEASDRYESWWRGGGLFLEQVLFSPNWKSGQTTVYARSIDDAVRALEMASTLEPGIAVEVASTPLEKTRLTKKQRARCPGMEAWASSPGAKRYPFGDESPRMGGAVWVLEDRGETTIHQYRVYTDEDGETELLAWDTFTASGGASRDMSV